ncbi:MAG: hypothetical protein AAF399_17555, partial [Bacteroidota bacterium]
RIATATFATEVRIPSGLHVFGNLMYPNNRSAIAIRNSAEIDVLLKQAGASRLPPLLARGAFLAGCMFLEISCLRTTEAR